MKRTRLSKAVYERNWDNSIILPGIDKVKLELMHDELVLELHINTHNLDKEVIQQPELFHKVSNMAALLLDVRDKAKQELIKLDSIIAIEIKDNKETLGEKHTIQSINNEVMQDNRREVKSEKHAYLKAQTSVWFALKEAYEQRSSMLSILVKLWAANYYSDPNTRAEEPERRQRTTRGIGDRKR